MIINIMDKGIVTVITKGNDDFNSDCECPKAATFLRPKFVKVAIVIIPVVNRAKSPISSTVSVATKILITNRLIPLVANLNKITLIRCFRKYMN